MRQSLGNENQTQRRGDAESAKDERITGKAISLCVRLYGSVIRDPETIVSDVLAFNSHLRLLILIPGDS